MPAKVRLRDVHFNSAHLIFSRKNVSVRVKKLQRLNLGAVKVPQDAVRPMEKQLQSFNLR